MRFKVIKVSHVLYYSVAIILMALIIALVLRLFLISRTEPMEQPAAPAFAADAQLADKASSDMPAQDEADFYNISLDKALPILLGQPSSEAQASVSLASFISSLASVNIGQPNSLLNLQIPMLAGAPQYISVSSRSAARTTPGVEKIEDEDGDIILHNSDDEVNIDINDVTDDLEDIQLTGSGPQILIYHTHATESYKPSSKYNYKPDNSRTTDTDFNMVRVGKQLAYYLKKDYAINVYQDVTLHDYPSYNDSYTNSLATIQKDMEKYPTLKMFLDLHRNAYGTSNVNPDDTVVINGVPAARILMVIGTGQGFKDKPQYKENYKLALKLKDELDKVAPGISKGIMVKTGRYNQHISTNAVLIEVGSDYNTLDEALESTKYLAKAIANVVKQ
ncbi:MAG: stage sporulation protein [Clostridiales bacterium]|nr:stage sporulation protein [Clostridiales bacterium]